MEINEKDKQKDPSKGQQLKFLQMQKNVDIVSGVVETASIPLKKAF